MQTHLLTKSSRRKKRGFSLLEITLVLGLAGIIFGGVWVAAQSVWDNYHLYRAAQQVAKVTQNIREYGMGVSGLQFSTVDHSGNPMQDGCDDDTAFLDSLGMFPAEMRRYCPGGNGGCASGDGGPYNYKIDNPFNNTDTYSGYRIAAGSFRVFGTQCTGASASHFQILLMFVPPSICAKLLMNAVNYNDPSLGVVKMCASSSITPSNGGGGNCFNETAWNIVQQANGTWGPNATTPLTFAEAQILCNTPASTTGYSEVGWEFTVRN